MLALSCVSDSNSMQCGDLARHCKEQIEATETSRVEAEKTPATRLFRKERQAPTLPVFSGRRQRQHRRIAQSPSRPGYLIEPLTGLGWAATRSNIYLNYPAEALNYTSRDLLPEDGL